MRGGVFARSSRTRAIDQRGQALVEAAIVVLLLTTLFMGVTEFGRAWMVGNMITQAAREGARAAAVTPSGNRDTSGNINGATVTNISTLVRNEIRGVLDSTTTDALTVNVNQSTSGGVPIVTVVVSGTVPYIFNFIATTFSVNRSVTFRDEGR